MEIHEYKRLRENKIHKTTQRQNRRITDRAGKETIDGRKPNETFSSREKIEILTNLQVSKRLAKSLNSVRQETESIKKRSASLGGPGKKPFLCNRTMGHNNGAT